MVRREFWLQKVEDAWRRRPLLWLRGVRRAGKTFLAHSIEGIEYFDCELPSVRRAIDDPESFLRSLGRKRVVLDEIHRLPNPSELLKIAADHFPNVRILATGSSSLGASSRFRDTLAGRKSELWLTPMIQTDLKEFGNPDLKHRLLRGGLPPFFMAEELPESDFQEWMDAYWAKDIQELFRLERKTSFQRFFELVLAQSGGIFEATRFAAPCEVSRTTITNYLAVLEATSVVITLRPFSSRRGNEIVAAPKVYGFDTGFVCVHRGWVEARPEDLGRLWEHFVLNELTAHVHISTLLYWRDKQGHEVDFVWLSRSGKPLAIECKWSARDGDPGALLLFGTAYPKFELAVVTTNAEPGFSRKFGEQTVRFMTLPRLIERVASRS